MGNRQTRKRLGRLPKSSYTKTQRVAIAKQIREYSEEDIVRDYSRLVEIGCRAKSQSTKKLTGNRVVDAFTFAERLNTVGSKGVRFYDVWKHRKQYSRKPYVRKYISFANAQHRQTPVKMWYNLYRFYFTSINCFRPLVAMEYYCRFSPKCVLDMTAGWGGRLVGACALDIPKYIGIDSNTDLREPYESMTAFLKPRTKTEIDMRFQDALSVDYSKLTYDMVFTSPPYYDLEQYGSQSPKYKTKEDWDADFYRPLFEQTYRHLSKGGHYCLNIPAEIFERVCVGLLGKPWKRIPLKKGDRQSRKENQYTEYVYVWRKE